MINKRIIGETMEKVTNKLFNALYIASSAVMNQDVDSYLYSTKSFEELCNLIQRDEEGNFFVDIEFIIKNKMYSVASK